MASASGVRISIMAAVRAGFGFLRDHFAEFVPGCILLGLVAALSGYLEHGLNQAANGGGGPEVRPVARIVAIYSIQLLASATFAGMVFRRALHNQGGGLAGLQFGRDEFRILGVQLALGFVGVLLAIPVGLMVFVMLGAMIGRSGVDPNLIATNPEAFMQALAEAIGPGGMMLGLGLMFAALLFVMYFSARLALVQAATVGEERMVIFQTWSWTRGNGWRIALAMMIILLPIAFVLNLVTSAVATVASRTGDGEGLSAVMQAAVSFGPGFFGGVMSIALFGMVAHVYRQLRPEGFVAK